MNASDWPLAPGNASDETEARFADLEAAWPEPTASLRDLVTGIATRTIRAHRAS